MKNCRTCKWADWRKNRAGRRVFYSYARCTFPVVPIAMTLPVSRVVAARELMCDVAVWEYKDVEINCGG